MRIVLLAVLCVSLAGCSAALRQPRAELGCEKLGDAAQAAVPFYAEGAVASVRPLQRTVSRTKAFENRETIGAELTLPAPAGVTAEQLERALACHARGTAEARPNDPLLPGGRIDRIAVRSDGAAFVVLVTSDDPDTGDEIWRRSRAFAASPPRVD